MEMIVGYRLIDSSGATVQQWGGVWGKTPDIPNPLRLPNGDDVHCADLDTDYSGWRLVAWTMDEPSSPVPAMVTPRQIRLLLLQQDLLDDVEALIAEQDRAVRITWEFATEFRRGDPFLLAMAQGLGLDEVQLDQFFVAAAAL